jgi:hypothetical protein
MEIKVNSHSPFFAYACLEFSFLVLDLFLLYTYPELSSVIEKLGLWLKITIEA